MKSLAFANFSSFKPVQKPTTTSIAVFFFRDRALLVKSAPAKSLFASQSDRTLAKRYQFAAESLIRESPHLLDRAIENLDPLVQIVPPQVR